MVNTGGYGHCMVSSCLPRFLASAKRGGSWSPRRKISVRCSTVALTALVVTAVFISGAIPLLVAPEPISAASVSPGVAAGNHTVGLKADGTVMAVGYNGNGQCNVGDWSDIQQVAAGSSHTVGLRTDGTVVAVGQNYDGQCDVNGWSNIVQVSAAGYQTVGLKADGTVVAVGLNGSGQCDVGTWDDIQQVSAGGGHTVGLKADGTVVAVGYSDDRCDVGSWTGIQQVAAGAGFTVGLKSDGTVVAVGDNSYGQSNISGWSDISQVAAGGYHTVGLKSDGTVVAAGDTRYGMSEVGDWGSVEEVAAGYYHTVARKSDGTVVAVGYNRYGECNVSGWSGIDQASAGGDFTVGLRSDGTVSFAGSDSNGQSDVRDWSGIEQVSAGEVHTVGLKFDGTVVAGRDNGLDQCNVGSWSGIEQVDAGKYHTVGLKSDGTVVAVGNDTQGQCDVGDWTGIEQVSAGESHTMGLESDGSVVAVGDNGYGQCDVSGWSNIQQVSAGGSHTIGLKSDGTVVAVGANGSGQCNVGTWNDIQQVSAGSNYTVGLKSDGTVVAVGYNGNGQCNVGAWVGIQQADAGKYHTVGLKSDGTVVAVGVNGSGQCNTTDWKLGIALAVSGISAVTKVYDGATEATLNTGNAALVGVLPGDNVTLVTSGAAGVFGDKNAGTGKTVTVSGLALDGSDAVNYYLIQPTTTASITPASLTVTGITADSKTYEGNTAATLNTTGATLVGVIPGDNVTLVTSGGTGTFADKNVGTGKAVSMFGLTLAGPDAGNYSLTQPTATASITQRPLTVAATGVDKMYDGSIDAIVTLSDNRVSGDSLTGSYATASFADKAPGQNKTIGVTGISISGLDAGNYSLSSTTTTAAASILPKILTVTGITAADKVYDGAATVTLEISGATLVGVVTGEDVVLVASGVATAFADKNVATGKMVTVSGMTLRGSDAGNYSLTQPTTTASITQRPLAVTATGIDRTYDGSTAASVTLSDDRVSGDSLTVSYVTVSFADKNVGPSKTVAVSGISISGSDAANYSVILTTATATASIVPKTLAVTGIVANGKTHDGTSAATLDSSNATLVGLVSGDDVTLVTSGAAGAFEDEAVGTGKAVTISGLTLSGSDAGNYLLAQYTTTADIDPAGGANWGLIVSAAVALVVVVGVASWLVLRRRSK